MEAAVAPRARKRPRPLHVDVKIHFPRIAHRAVDLHSSAGSEIRGIRGSNLCVRYGRLCAQSRIAHASCGVIQDRSCELELHLNARERMLDRLIGSDRPAELPTLAGVRNGEID